MKKVLAIVLCVAMVAALCVSLVACNPTDDEGLNEITMPAYEGLITPDYSSLVIPADFKVGLICLHDKNSTYDKNFIEAMEDAQATLGLSDEQVVIVTGIPEDNTCYEKAKELAQNGCDIIFANSFGHEQFILRAAQEFPNVQFCHATGVKAHTSNDVANYGNAFASIYEGRYLAGVAAGLKLKELYADANGNVSSENAKIGYVGAYTYAEVVSGYTSFYLGVKSIVSNVTMEVQFTGSWYDETAENNAAKALINRGAKLISQHADSMGAPNACEEANIPNVSYNGSTLAACPNTFIISSRINWTPYYLYAIAQKVNGQAAAKDWTGTLATGSVVLTHIGGPAAAAGTAEKLVEVRSKIVSGDVKVFDTATFTVGGEAKTSYLADVDDFGDYQGETEVIENGAFAESKYRSAPYFDLQIDGITLLNSKY